MEYTKFSVNRSIDEAKKIFESRIEDAEIIFEKFNQEFEYRPCPICGEDEYTSLEKFIEKYSIVKCETCNSQYVNPVPSINALTYYYNECKNNRLFANLNLKRQNHDFRLDTRIAFIKQYIEIVLSRVKDRKINFLEIGCNTGTFLSILSDYISSIGAEAKIDIYGIDIDENAINSSVNESLNLMSMPAESIKELDIKFDLIVNFEVIEHLRDPVSFAKSIYDNLVHKGFHIFTTPNSLGLEIKAIGYNKTRLLAHSIFPPMHLNAFNTENILLFANKIKFKLKSLETPGLLDMDLITKVKDELDDNELKQIVSFDDKTKAYFQYLVAYLNSSSHMRVVLEK